MGDCEGLTNICKSTTDFTFLQSLVLRYSNRGATRTGLGKTQAFECRRTLGRGVRIAVMDSKPTVGSSIPYKVTSKTANREIGAPRKPSSILHSRGYIPHFESPDRIQHVTFH